MSSGKPNEEISYRSQQIMSALLVDLLDTALAQSTLPCETATSGILLLLLTDSNDKYGKALRKLHPAILRACTRFLMAPRTHEQREALAAIQEPPPGHCGCDLTHIAQQIHDPEVMDAFSVNELARPPSVLGRLLESFARALTVTTNTIISQKVQSNAVGMRKVFKDGEKAARLGRREPWPSNQWDLMPYGIEESMLSLCSWARYWPDIRFLRLVRTLYVLTAHPGIPRVIIQSVYPLVFVPIMEHVRTQLERYGRQRSPPASNTELDAVSTGISFLEFTATITADHCLSAIIARSSVDWDAVTGVCLGTYATIVGIWDVSRGTAVGQLCARLIYQTTWAQRLHAPSLTALARNPEEALGALAQVYAILARETFNTQPVWLLGRFARQMYLPRVCARAGCTRIYALETYELRACAACQRVYYCSRECQRAAWTYPPAPHQAVCGALQDMSRILAAHSDGAKPVDHATFMELTRRAQLDPALAQPIYDNLKTIYSL